MTEKQALHQHCQQHVRERLTRLQAEIKAIQQSANEETKSSAGDKYETGRAMAQLELERMMTQTGEMEKLVAGLKALNPEIICQRVQPGALVSTTNGIFYISVSLGLITLNTVKYFVVSPDSPVARLLMGKQVGDTVIWNGDKQIINGLN